MSKTINSVEKALRILDLLAEHYNGLRVSEIAQLTGVPYSTAHRLVCTLETNGYITGSPDTGRYSLSLKILGLYRALNHRMNLTQICFPYLSQLMEKYWETVHLAVYNDGEVVYLNTIVSPRSLAMYTEPGKRAPIHATALGKVLAAYLPEDQVLAVLAEKGMKRFTPNTIVSPEKFLEALQWVRTHGYAVDNEEVELGVRCVASSLINHNGNVVGAVSVSAPSARLPLEKIGEIAESVMATCDAASRALGATEAAIRAHRSTGYGKRLASQ
ncbi:MAG TPA: IclR family transcriptional regulator [Firmicutes bacterium]|nr:IclR family transcriptional regulator [Bacillota bacterium]